MYQSVSATLRKTVASLGKAKYRRELGLFVAEGVKCAGDLMDGFDCEMIFASTAWLEEHPDIVSHTKNVYAATRADLERMTQLSTAPEIIAVFRIPECRSDFASIGEDLVLALDRVQDPGNLGTIIRVADWMGVTDILASEGTADVFNPKVVQATMGSLSRVRVHYVDDLASVLSAKASAGVPVYGTFLNGDDIYSTDLSVHGIVVMGNEGNGVSDEVAHTVSHRLLIPSYPPGRSTAESLNVATATAITLAEFRRRAFPSAHK